MNEGVKISTVSSSHVRSNPMKDSYKRCLCCIATVIVLTVAAIVVFLALNTQKPDGNNVPTENKVSGEFKNDPGTNNNEKVILDRIKDSKVRNWKESEEETTTKMLFDVPSTTNIPLRTFVRWRSERFPETPQPTQEIAVAITTTTKTVDSVNDHEVRTTEDPRNFVTTFSYPRKPQREDENADQKQKENQLELNDIEDHTLQVFNTTKSRSEGYTTATPFQTTRSTITPVPPLAPTTINTLKLFQKSQSIKTHSPKELDCPKTCDTPKCIKSLSSILMKMDFDTDPCDDFYKYSCNGQVVNRIKMVPLEESFRVQMRKYLEKDPRNDPFLLKYKTFHESCLKFKCDGTTDPVVKFFRPLLNHNIPSNGELNEKRHHLTHLIGRILVDGHPSSRVIPLFDVEVEYDDPLHKGIPVITMPTHPSLLQTAHSDDLYVVNCKRDTEQFVISESQSSSADIYQFYQDCLQNNTNYIHVLEKSMRIFEIFHGFPEFEREQRLKQIITTIEWDVLDEVKRLSDTEILQEHSNSNGEIMSIDRLEKACSEIDWKVLFPILFDEPVKDVKVRFRGRLGSLCQFYKKNDFE